MWYTYIILFTLAIHVIISDGSNNKKRIRILKRSIEHIVQRDRTRNGFNIDTAVDDITESTAFSDREKNWKAMMAGEMYPEHMHANMKRKEVERRTQTPEEPRSESNDEEPEIPLSRKKTRIEGHNIQREENLAETAGAEEYDDSNQDGGDDTNDDSNESESNGDSGSGSGESNTATPDHSINNEESSEQEKEEDVSSTGDRREEKLQCHKKCSMPMTYHECAHPRCNLKVGTIKDLCFYLCKHQKERCEDVCE